MLENLTDHMVYKAKQLDGGKKQKENHKKIITTQSHQNNGIKTLISQSSNVLLVHLNTVSSSKLSLSNRSQIRPVQGLFQKATLGGSIHLFRLEMQLLKNFLKK